MRQIFTQFFFLVLLVTTVNAQDSRNLKYPSLRIPGKRPLLSISNTDSSPVLIRIRCRASDWNPEPLIVIDGVMAEKFGLKNLDPNNIESIEILKEAEGAALYGCRAASGVLLITTKTANDRTISVKDMLTGEILASANIDLISIGKRKDTIHLVTDSAGKIVTNKIFYGEEYELKVSNVGYKNFRCIVNAKQLGKNYDVLLRRNYEDLEEVSVKSTVMKSVHKRRTNNVYFDGLYGSLRCLSAGINILSSDQINIQDRKSINNIKVYPNPVLRNQKINIEFENEEDNKLTVRLYSLDGKLICFNEFQIKKGVNKISYLPGGSLTIGIYIQEIIYENNLIVKTDKLIIQ